MKPKGEQASVSTESLLDLLEPIEKENPWRWVRYENKYPMAEKNEDDPNLPMGEWERPLKQTD